jgi:fibronectin-binding autotransporter adhesin
MIRKPLIAGVCALAVIAAGAPVARAQTTYTWTGAGTDANWSTAGNWSGSVLPVSDPNNTLIVLSGANRTTNILDLAQGGTFSINKLTQLTSTAFTINPISPTTSFTTLAIGSGGIVVGDASNTGGLTINVPVNLTASQTWATNNTGALTVANPNPPGIGGVNVADGITWTLGGSSSGGITVSAPVTFAGSATIALSTAGTSATTYTISGAVIIPGTLTLNVPGSRSLTISGSITPPGASGGSITVNGGGSGIVTLSNGGNAYTGATIIQGGGILATGAIANGTFTSGIGASDSGAGNLVLNNGTFRYTGAANVTDRLFTVTQNGGTLDASGSGALVFTTAGNIAMTGSGARTFTLTGSSSFANTLTPVITDGAGGATSLVKNGTGYWILAANNTYTGSTTITNGTLQYNSFASIPAAGVNLNGGSFAAGYAMDQAFLGKINNTPPANSSVALGVDSSNNLDFTAANLANVRLGAAPGPFPGTNTTYSGTITPNGSNYRFGNPSGGILLLSQPLTDGVSGPRGVDMGVGGTVIFGGANTFTGSTAVSGGTVAVNRPTAGSNPFGNGTITLSGGGLSFRGAATPLTVTGFNQDVIISQSDRSSGSPFGATTGIDGTPGNPFNGFALWETNPNIINAAWPGGVPGVTQPTALPSNRQVTNAANPLTSYKLADYGSNGVVSNNALYLSSNAGITTGTLSLSSPGSFQALSFLVTSGNGTATFSAKLNFLDGSSTTISNLTSPDWFNNNPFAIGNLGRMNNVGFPDTTAINNPRLYPIDIALSGADAGKTLTSILFTYQGGANSNTTLNVLGVSGVASGGASSYSNPVTVTGNASLEMLQMQSLNLGQLTIGNVTLTVNGALVSGSGNLTFPGTLLNGSAGGNTTFTVNGGTGTILTVGGVNTVSGGTILNPGVINFNNAARTITKNGVGALQLDFAAANATATNTLTANLGIVNVNNATALGTNPNLNVATSAPNGVNVGTTVNMGPYTGLNNLSVSGGTANLPNVATLTGNATITGGTANFGVGVAVNGSGGTTVNGGTVNLGGNSTTTRLQGTGGTINMGASNLQVGSGNATDSYAGIITGTGSIIKVGTGTQTLSFSSPTNSSYSGGTNVTSGKVVATRPGTLGTGAVTLANNTTLTVGGLPGATISGFGGNGTGWNRQGVTAPAVVADVMTLTPNTGNQANSAWFNTAFNIPTIASGNGAFTASFKYSDVNANNGGADGITFALQSASSTATGGGGGGLGYSGIGQSMAFQTNIYVPNNPGINVRTNGAAGTPYDSTGSITTWNSGPGNEILVNLTYDGGTSYTVTLTQGANTFTKTYTVPTLTSVVNPGSVFIGFTGGTGGAQAQQNVSNFSFNWTGTSAPPVSTYTNNVILPTGVAATIAPLVATGVTTFTLGNLSMGSGAALTVASDPVSLANTSFNLTLGTTTLNSAATFSVANNGAGTGILNLGALNDGGTAATITKAGVGTLVLPSAATSLVDGTQVNVTGGTLQVTNATSMGTLAAVNLAASTTLLLGAAQTVGALTGTGGVFLNGNTLTVGSTNNLSSTFDGTITNGTAAGALVKAGNGTLTLTGANTHSGGTTLNNGALNINSSGTASSSPIGTGTFTIAGGTIDNTSGSPVTLATNNAQAWNANFAFGGSNALNLGTGAVALGGTGTARTVTTNGTAPLTVGGTIGGTLGLTKAGGGTLILTGANTYGGPTAVNAGTLLANGNQAAATGAVSVASGATLGGTGTLGGTTTLGAGATLAPGPPTAIGTLTVSNNVTVTGGTGSTWVIKVNGDGSTSSPPPVNTPNDRLDLTGASSTLNVVADATHKLTLSVQDLPGYNATQGTPLSYTIATVPSGGSIQSNGLAFTFNPNAYTLQAVNFLADPNFQLSVSGSQLVLTFTPVPEPGMMLAMSAVGLGLLAWARRRLRHVRAVTGGPALG